MQDTQSLIGQKIELHKTLGAEVCQKMLETIRRLGFSEEELGTMVPDYEQAHFSLAKDPYTSCENLNGNWFDQKKQRIGHIQFLSDGSFYAEYDIVKPHPSKKQWFVEAVTAWGKAGQIKAEAKLLPALQ